MTKQYTCIYCGATLPRATKMCYRCRYERGKRSCPMPGCTSMISRDARTCMLHRPNQKPQLFSTCVECGSDMPPSGSQVCDPCRATVRVQCACGCGRYRRKYTREGYVHLYISGHNDNWVGHRRPLVKCAVCGKEFSAASVQTRLCSVACRTQWLTINPPHARKRIQTECAVCGVELFRAPYQLAASRDAVCSKRCHYILVANKLRNKPTTDVRLISLRRDSGKCRICGFDVLVEVHHILARRNGGPDEVPNLITLCPNHHTMADRGLITKDVLYAAIQVSNSLAESDRGA